MTTIPERAQIEREIAAMIAAKAKRDPSEIHADSTLNDVGLSSLDAIELLFDIEEHYGITFPEQGPNFGSDTLAQLVDAVESSLRARPPEHG